MHRRHVSLLVVILAVLTVAAWPAATEQVSGTRPESASPGSGTVTQVFSQQQPGQFNPDIYLKRQQDLFAWLVGEQPSLSGGALVSVAATARDLEDIRNHECQTCGDTPAADRKVRIGVAKPVSVPVNFSDLTPDTLPKSSRLYRHGMLNALPDGGFVWLMMAEAQDATAVRIHFSDFSLPSNAAMYIYNQDGEAFGPYTDQGPNRDGDFWTNTVSGPVAFIQLRQFGRVAEKDLRTMTFKVSDVAWLGPGYLLPLLQHPPADKDFCSFNASCVVDASCYNTSDWGAIDSTRYGVAHMQFVSGAYIYICSGGLLADTDTTTWIPYFLTANHCISKSREASSLECYWQFMTSSCGGACYDPVGAVPRTLGADLLSSSKTGDYTLMRLNAPAPPGSVFLGWNAEAVAYADGTDLYRLSHPKGAPQAFSRHQVDTSAGTCRSWPRGSWIYSRDVIGATEGGSSGSPVLNAAGQVVGQLSGGCGTNVNDVCDSVSNATVDGAFASYYSSVAGWLNPGGGSFNSAPEVTITSPANGAVYTEGDSITFAGTATDQEDGDLTASLTWTSNLDGQIGTGGSFAAVLSVGTHTVTAAATDSGGLTGESQITVTVNASGGGITLSATGYKVKGLQKADLSWSGAGTAMVDIYRDGVLIATTANDGAFTDNINNHGGGSYVYRVCESGGSTCSNNTTVTF